jgi:hypothetical protein
MTNTYDEHHRGCPDDSYSNIGDDEQYQHHHSRANVHQFLAIPHRPHFIRILVWQM